ncbi:MAG: hypothetical protein WCJ25_04350 [Candidatus Moraniibacteriota bacterium]
MEVLRGWEQHPERFVQYANDLRAKLFKVVVATGILIFMVIVICSKYLQMMDFVIGIGIIIGTFWVIADYRVVLPALGLGAASKLPNFQMSEVLQKGAAGLPDVEIKKLVQGGWEALIKYVVQPVTVFAFLISALAFFHGIFQIQVIFWALPELALLLMVALVNVLPESPIKKYAPYGMIIGGIIVICGLYGAFETSSKQATPVSVPSASSPVNNPTQGPEAAPKYSGKTFGVTVKSLEPITLTGIPDGERTFRLVDANPVIIVYIPDSNSNTGMSATRNSLKDPAYTLVAGEGTVNGGKITVTEGKISIRLRVPPDTEENLRSGKFKLGETTINVAFE